MDFKEVVRKKLAKVAQKFAAWKEARRHKAECVALGICHLHGESNCYYVCKACKLEDETARERRIRDIKKKLAEVK